MTQNANISVSGIYRFCKKNRGILSIEINQAFILLRRLKILPMHLYQIRSIENYWGILKMKVYEENWTAQIRDLTHQNEAKGNQLRYCH